MAKANRIVLGVAILGISFAATRGANTVFIEHKTEAQFKKGTAERTLIRSDGQLTLAYDAHVLLESNPKLLAINAIEADSQGNIYLAASGLGHIYRILSGESKAELLYGDNPNDSKHVFSLGFDSQGYLLAGTGGEKAALLRQRKEKGFDVLFQDETVKYIWAIVTGPAGRIYLGTGPEGKIFTLDPDGTNPQMLYRAKDTNILSLALDANGILFAGGDKYGLVYRIDPATGQTVVAYDTGHKEIRALILDSQQNVYISTSDTGVSRRGASLILSDEAVTPIRPVPAAPEAEEGPPEEGPPEGGDDMAGKDNTSGETETPETPSGPDSEPVDKLSPPETPGPEAQKPKIPETPEEPERMMRPGRVNEIFKMTPDGFVRSIFQKPVVIFDLVYNPSDHSLLLATADQGRILKFDLETQKVLVLHSASPSVQVTSLKLLNDGSVAASLGNPSGALKILPSYASSGYYQSEPIDGQNITRWGTVHIDGDIPDQTHLNILFRTGNTSNPEEGPWSEWSEPLRASESLSIPSLPGRFLQYRLDFSTESPVRTATVRSLKLSQRQPNYPPRVTYLNTIWAKEQKPKGNNPFPEELNLLQIQWKAEDDNRDSLLYNLYLRPCGTDRWVQIAKELKTVSHKWDSRLVEDGPYEIKVEATDKLSNTAHDTLSDVRIGDPFIVDNTPPQVADFTWNVSQDSVEFSALLKDDLTTIQAVQYSLDSSELWQSAQASDGLFDNKAESIQMKIKVDTEGSHWLSLRICDGRGNAVYKNINFTTTH